LAQPANVPAAKNRTNAGLKYLVTSCTTIPQNLFQLELNGVPEWINNPVRFYPMFCVKAELAAAAVNPSTAFGNHFDAKIRFLSVPSSALIKPWTKSRL
jgi:hypothetical protein